MFTQLFHKDVFFPKDVDVACNKLQRSLKEYSYSKHFEEHLNNQGSEDRSHRYPPKDILVKCLNSLHENPRQVFEVELGKDYHFFGKSGWFVTKYCCRIPCDDGQDLVVVIRPQYEGAIYKKSVITTAWMNQHDDNHYTLDESKYCTEESWKKIN